MSSIDNSIGYKYSVKGSSVNDIGYIQNRGTLAEKTGIIVVKIITTTYSMTVQTVKALNSWVISPLITGLKMINNGFKATASKLNLYLFKPAWNNIIVPCFKVLKSVATTGRKVLVDWVFKPLTKILSSSIKELISRIINVANFIYTAVLQPTWNQLLKPALEILEQVVFEPVKLLHNWVFKPILNALDSGLNFIIPRVIKLSKFIFQNILKPTWQNILVPTWQKVIDPTLEVLGTVFKTPLTKLEKWVFTPLITNIVDFGYGLIRAFSIQNEASLSFLTKQLKELKVDLNTELKETSALFELLKGIGSGNSSQKKAQNYAIALFLVQAHNVVIDQKLILEDKVSKRLLNCFEEKEGNDKKIELLKLLTA